MPFTGSTQSTLVIGTNFQANVGSGFGPVMGAVIGAQTETCNIWADFQSWGVIVAGMVLVAHTSAIPSPFAIPVKYPWGTLTDSHWLQYGREKMSWCAVRNPNITTFSQFWPIFFCPLNKYDCWYAALGLFLFCDMDVENGPKEELAPPSWSAQSRLCHPLRVLAYLTQSTYHHPGVITDTFFIRFLDKRHLTRIKSVTFLNRYIYEYINFYVTFSSESKSIKQNWNFGTWIAARGTSNCNRILLSRICLKAYHISPITPETEC